MISLAGTARPALASCGGVTNVSNEAQLNASIAAGNITFNGGGIHNAGILTLSSATITNNTAGQEGGGLWNSVVGTVTIQNESEVQNNVADIANAAFDAQGGGRIFNNRGDDHGQRCHH